jgi:riboflavin transporter FmnP
MSLSFILGWIIMIIGWVFSYFLKDKQESSMIGLVMSAIAFGLFVGAMLSTIKIIF